METILPVDAQMAAFPDEKLIKLLAHPSGIVRARALPTLGARTADSPPLKEAVFAAAADPANLQLEFYAFVKVAWVAALTILDYGTPQDFERLTDTVHAWPEHEQENFLAYLKGYQGFEQLMRARRLA